MASNITFVGGAGATDVETFNWGGLDFAKNTPVLVDPDAAETAEQRRFYEYMIIKAGTHPGLTVEDAPPPPEARKSKAKDAKARAAELGQPAEDDYPEEPTNGDLDADYYELPKDWKDLHHKKLIALAKRLGGEGDALATRDGAIEYIEERVTLEGNRLHLERHDA
jgi:hypothetical protein